MGKVIQFRGNRKTGVITPPVESSMKSTTVSVHTNEGAINLQEFVVYGSNKDEYTMVLNCDTMMLTELIEHTVSSLLDQSMSYWEKSQIHGRLEKVKIQIDKALSEKGAW